MGQLPEICELWLFGHATLASTWWPGFHVPETVVPWLGGHCPDTDSWCVHESEIAVRCVSSEGHTCVSDADFWWFDGQTLD